MAGPLGQEMQHSGLAQWAGTVSALRHEEAGGLAAGMGVSSKITHTHT